MNRIVNNQALNKTFWFLYILLFTAQISAQSPMNFEDAVSPLLRKNCIACHNAKLSEGGLNLESFATLSKGGDSGPAFETKQSDKSELIKRIVSKGDDAMPPKNNTVGAETLSANQIQIIHDWIAQGALSNGLSKIMQNNEERKLPETARASYAIAVSSDADFVAFGRGGQLVIQNALPLSLPTIEDGALNSPADTVISNAHSDFIHSLAISPDGMRIASGSTGEVKIWTRKNISSGSILAALDKAQVPITQLFCTTTDGQWMSTIRPRVRPKDASVDSPVPGVLTIINRQGEIVQSMDIPDANLNCGTWSPTNQHFYALGKNKSLYVWDLSASTVTTPVQLVVPKESQHCVALNDGILMVVSQRSVSAWKVGDSAIETIADHPLTAAMNAMGPVDFFNVSQDRSLLASGTYDENKTHTELKLWSIPQAKILGTFARDRQSDQQFSRADQIAFRAQAAHERSKANVTELEKALQAEETAVKTALSNRDKMAESVTKKEQERVAAVQAMADHEKSMTDTQAAIDAATKKLETLKTELEAKKKAVTDLEKQKADAQTAAENAVQSLAATEESQKAAAVRLEAKKTMVTQLADEWANAQSRSLELKKAADSIKLSANAVAFTNGRFIATLSTPNEGHPTQVELFSLETMERTDVQLLPYLVQSQASLGALLAGCKGFPSWELERIIDSPRIIIDRVTALAFNSDSSQLAIGSGLPSRSGQLSVVQTADGIPIKLHSQTAPNPESDAVDLHSDTILNLNYSPDGKWLASCGADKMTKLLDAKTNSVMKVFEGHTHHVLALAWQESGHRIATASADTTVKIWDIEKGEAVRTITGFGTEVTSLSFVGRTPSIVSSTMNNLVRLHDVDSGKQNKQFGPAGDSLYSVAVTPNGKYTLSSGQEGIVRIWKIEDGKLVGEWK